MPSYLDRDVLREARSSVFDDASEEIVARAKRELKPAPPRDFSLPDIGGLTSIWGRKPPPAPAAPRNAAAPAADSYALPALDGLTSQWGRAENGGKAALNSAPAGAVAPGPRLPPEQAVQQISALVPQQLPLGNPTAMAQALAPALRFAEQQLGISAASAFSIIMAENGAGNSPLSAQHNNFFSLSSTKDDPYQSDRSQRFGGYATPGDGIAAFYHWMTDFPRYKEALANGQDHAGFINGLVKAGYIVPEPGFPVEQWIQNTGASAGLFTQAAGPAPPAAGVVRGAFQTMPEARGAVGTFETMPTQNGVPSPGVQRLAGNGQAASLSGTRPTQFAPGLSWDEAVAACGLAAATAFATANGRTPTVREARDLAVSLGVWDAGSGMHGAESEVKLLNNMGIAAHTERGLDWSRVAREVGAGNPVMFDTTGGSAGHYYTVEGYDPKTGQFDLGTSATDLRGANGRQWFRPEEIQGIGFGAPYTAIYLDNPLTPTASPNARRPVPPPPPVAAPLPPPEVAAVAAPAASAGAPTRPVRQTIERDEQGRIAAVVDHHEDGALRREVVRDEVGRVVEVVPRPVTIEQTPEALDAAPPPPADEIPFDQYPMMAGAI